MAGKVYGWLTPKKQYVECDMYEHLKVIARLMAWGLHGTWGK